MTSVLFLLLVLSLIINLVQLINAQSDTRRQRDADKRIIYACMDAGTTVYRTTMGKYRSSKEVNLFHRALGAMDAVAAIREKFPKV